jgi:DNA-nicking Smr family endonuclease
LSAKNLLQKEGFLLHIVLVWFCMKKNYSPVILEIIDLHQRTAREAYNAVTAKIDACRGKIGDIHVIVGKGLHSKAGPILPDTIKNLCVQKKLSWRPAKVFEGGTGVIIISIR